jgi:hypothetical protein
MVDGDDGKTVVTRVVELHCDWRHAFTMLRFGRPQQA